METTALSTSSISSSREVLRKVLLSKIKLNPAYSARAFARDIGVSPAFVTQVLNGQKKININRAIDIVKALKLKDNEKQALLESVFSENGMSLKIKSEIDRDTLVDLSDEQFSVVADWYHFAILDLTTTKGFQSKAPWIAKRLGISVFEVEMALIRLVKVGLIVKSTDGYRKAHKQVTFPTKVSMVAVREHHRQMMDRAKSQLEKTDAQSFKNRMIVSITCAADTRKIEEAREKIAEFQQELANFLSDGDECEEVYQLNIQLFPHTKTKE